MFDLIRNIILTGRFELSDLMNKIDTLWLQGSLTDAQKSAAIALAREKTTPDMGYAGIEARMKNCEEQIALILSHLFGENVQDEYPAWQQPTGAHNAYYTGSKMTFTDGKRYVCIAPADYAVTYGPDLLPDMWQSAE